MRWFVVAILMIRSTFSIGQSSREIPQIGKALPEFRLENVRYYDHSVATNECFRGKWLFLHFWSLGCSSAVKSLDLADAIQKEFRDDIQVLLVGHLYGEMNERGIEIVFERKRNTGDYDLPIAYDTVLYDDWALGGVPAIYIVDPKGILKYVTSGSDLTLEKVKEIIEGRDVSLRPMDMNYTDTSGNGIFKEVVKDEDILYASVLTRWRGEYPSLGYEMDRFVRLPTKYKNEGWSLAFASLIRLYQYAYYGQGWFFMADTAYYGKVFELPILDLSDKTPFIDHDFATGRGYYNYYLKLPPNKVDKSKMMKEMQLMLNVNFGYDAKIETHDMPVWRLERSNDSYLGLRTKGGEPKFFGINSVAGVKVQNYPMRDFLRLISANLPNEDKIPFLDYTHIGFRVDANIQADMTNFGSVQKALSRYGLKLVRGKKRMNVLVIRDADLR